MNQDERHGLLALAHEHLPGGGAQRPQPLSHDVELFSRAALEQLHIGQTFGAHIHQFCALAQRRCQAVLAVIRCHHPILVIQLVSQ